MPEYPVQFGRKYRLILDTRIIEDLDIMFRAVRTGTTEPNTIDLQVLNLNKNTRQQLTTKQEFDVQLEAGYEENIGTVFLGGVRNVSSIYEKPDWKTMVSSGDGEKETQESRINKSFAKGTDLAVVMKEAAKAISGIGLGNLSQALVKGKLPNGAKSFVNGVTLSGSAAKEFDKLCRSAGLQWSIQDKKLQLLKANETLTTRAVVLTPATGLIGSPTVSSDGILKYTALLNPNIVPGTQLVVDSRDVSGRFKAERCEYTGDTSARPWYVQGEGKILK